MKLLSMLAVTALFSTSLAIAQVSPSGLLSPGTTLPIQFEHTVDPAHAHAGDPVSAKTTQQVVLANGQILPAGAHVTGHVITANGFNFNKTPYAKQSPSTLSIRFDSLATKEATVPLHVSLRAMADPLTVWAAQEPKSTDLDPLSTTTQIGGDLVTPSQNEVMSQDGDIVGYHRHGGVVAHLISASGKGLAACDGSDTEQSMGLFSASACGLYGYTDVSLVDNGLTRHDSSLTLISRRRSAKIWAKTAALLEVSSQGQNMVSQ
jgi:hypothetical protein